MGEKGLWAGTGLRKLGDLAGERAYGRSPSAGASSFSCSRARGSSCRRCAGIPEHRARASPGSTPCVASIRFQWPRAEPSSVGATRAAPSAGASPCPLSSGRVPPKGEGGA